MDGARDAPWSSGPTTGGVTAGEGSRWPESKKKGDIWLEGNDELATIEGLPDRFLV
jgi:hypothetical protein